MSIGIKVNRENRSTLFNTEDPSLQVVMAIQQYVGDSPDGEYVTYNYEHNLGYYPLVIAFVSQDGGKTWSKNSDFITWDEKNITFSPYIQTGLTRTFVFYVFPVNIKSDTNISEQAVFDDFIKEDNQMGIEIFNQSSDKTFSSELRVLHASGIKKLSPVRNDGTTQNIYHFSDGYPLYLSFIFYPSYAKVIANSMTIYSWTDNEKFSFYLTDPFALLEEPTMVSALFFKDIVR